MRLRNSICGETLDVVHFPQIPWKEANTNISKYACKLLSEGVFYFDN